MTAAVPAGPMPILETKEAAFGPRTIHEAGHAVVCFLLYGEHVVKGLTVTDDAQPGVPTYSLMPVPIVCRPPAGVPRRGTPAPVSIDGIVDAYGVMSYAGMAAEGLHSASSDSKRARPAPPDLDMAVPDLRARSLEDRAELQRLAALVGAERNSAHFFVEYWDEALRLLRAHWEGVETLAALLTKHRQLNGDRVDELLRGHCPS